jgi:hypothetical protein
MRDAQRINACRAIEHESDSETQNEDEDTHARTAKLLFGVSGRNQMEDSQGISREQIRSSDFPRGMRMLVEGGCSEDATIPKMPRATRASVSQQNIGTVTLRTHTDPDFALSQTPIRNSTRAKDTCLGDADHKLSSSFSAVFDASSFLSLASPSSNRSYTTGQDDLSLIDLQNIPPTGTETKRRRIRSHSRSQSQSLSLSQSQLRESFPSSTHLSITNPAAKRRKVKTRVDVHYGPSSSTPALVSPEGVVCSQSVEPGVIQVRQSTNAALQAGCTEERSPNMDGELRRVQRRALRARSRAIEERLRHALPMHVR